MTERIGELSLPPEVVSVTRARHYVRDTLTALGVPDCADDAQLAVSELIANAVKHARTPLVLELTADDEHLTVTVADGERELASQVQQHALAESGRGLRIVAAIASEWGVEPREGGKALWFRLPLRKTRGRAPVVQLHSSGAEQHARSAETTGRNQPSSRSSSG
ncbi:MAG: ATP-binding protein [Angustibacter sp.]